MGGDNKFAKQSTQLDDVLRRRFFFRQAFEIYGGARPRWSRPARAPAARGVPWLSTRARGCAVRCAQVPPASTRTVRAQPAPNARALAAPAGARLSSAHARSARAAAVRAGPPGSAVKNNLISLWRKHFVIEEGLMEIEDTNIMPHPVLKASGHVDRFSDYMGARACGAARERPRQARPREWPRRRRRRRPATRLLRARARPQ